MREERFFDGLSTFELLEELIGTSLATHLCELYGGQTVYIPANPLNSAWLPQAVGLEAARTLCNHYTVNNSGMRVSIPKGRKVSGRQADVALMADQGLSVSEIARELDLHQRSVYRLRRAINIRRAKRIGPLIGKLKAKGCSLEEIAKQLHLPPHSIKAVVAVMENKHRFPAPSADRMIERSKQ